MGCQGWVQKIDVQGLCVEGDMGDLGYCRLYVFPKEAQTTLA